MFKTHAMYVVSDKLMRDGITLEEVERKMKDMPKAVESAHDGPPWSVSFCIFVLASMIVLFAAVAHVLVATVEPAAHALGFSESFAGLTLIAIIPNTTSFVNAVRFSLENRIRLSIEIGCSVATQVGLLQLPMLNLMLLFLPQPDDTPHFTLVFGGMTVFFLVFSTMITIYVLFAGRANYFEGVVLMVVYVLIICTFYFTPDDLPLASEA